MRVLLLIVSALAILPLPQRRGGPAASQAPFKTPLTAAQMANK